MPSSSAAMLSRGQHRKPVIHCAHERGGRRTASSSSQLSQQEKQMSAHARTSIVGLFTCAALLVALPASAQDAPRSYIASPDVYKVIAENGKTKVILATWPP